MTAREISDRFSFINPNTTAEIAPGFFKNRGYLVVTARGQLMQATSGSRDWLHYAAINDEYLPAKIGLELIKAAKQPLRSKIRSLVSVN